jgi:hypothetical protein
MPNKYIQDLINKHYSYLNRKERRIKINKTIKESKPELINLFKSEYIINERQLKGITCFSEDNLNLLMWSLYADSHKGICIGFNIEKLYHSVKRNGYNEVALLKVIYVNELEPINFFEDSYKAVANWMRTKSDSWKYEKEIRLSFGPYKANNADCDFVSFDLKAIEEIYLGSQMQNEEEDKIIKFIESNNLTTKIYKISLNDQKFKLERNEIQKTY